MLSAIFIFIINILRDYSTISVLIKKRQVFSTFAEKKNLRNQELLSMPRADQFMVDGFGDGLGAGGSVQFAQDVVHMILYG